MYMKYNTFIYLLSFILLFLPQNSFSKAKINYFLFCSHIHEGNPFGLIFEDEEVTQIGVENFKKVLDYSENFSKKGNFLTWYNVVLNTKTLRLHIGKQNNFFAKCEKVKSSIELNNMLEFFIRNEQNKNTI